MLLHGMKHVLTRDTAMSLVRNLREVGRREEAEALAAKHGLAEQLQASKETVRANRETRGDGHFITLRSIGRLADLLEALGKLVEATPLYTEALEGCVLRYGMKDVMTRDAAERLVSNLREVGQREEAEALADKHGLADK